MLFGIWHVSWGPNGHRLKFYDINGGSSKSLKKTVVWFRLLSCIDFLWLQMLLWKNVCLYSSVISFYTARRFDSLAKWHLSVGSLHVFLFPLPLRITGGN